MFTPSIKSVHTPKTSKVLWPQSATLSSDIPPPQPFFKSSRDFNRLGAVWVASENHERKRRIHDERDGAPTFEGAVIATTLGAVVGHLAANSGFLGADGAMQASNGSGGGAGASVAASPRPQPATVLSVTKGDLHGKIRIATMRKDDEGLKKEKLVSLKRAFDNIQAQLTRKRRIRVRATSRKLRVVVNRKLASRLRRMMKDSEKKAHATLNVQADTPSKLTSRESERSTDEMLQRAALIIRSRSFSRRRHRVVREYIRVHHHLHQHHHVHQVFVHDRGCRGAARRKSGREECDTMQASNAFRRDKKVRFSSTTMGEDDGTAILKETLRTISACRSNGQESCSTKPVSYQRMAPSGVGALADAMRSLHRYQHHPEAVPTTDAVDELEAALQRSAEMGSLVSAYNLGVLLVQRNKRDEAVKWFLRAAECGDQEVGGKMRIAQAFLMVRNYPPSSGLSGDNDSKPSFFKAVFKGGDRTGIRTTLTRRQVFLAAAVVIGIVVGIALAVGLTLGLRKSNNDQSSGPTKVVLICLDGFKPEFINSGLTPNIKKFFDEGAVSKNGLVPVFPAQSFPNQYTMLTGLLPAYHGIVGDYFHDDKINSVNPISKFTTFARNESGTVSQDSFWQGIPLWTTLTTNKLPVATVNWPGTSVSNGFSQLHYKLQFDKSQTDAQRVEFLLSWMQGVNLKDGASLPKPIFIATHFRDADANGTILGPDVTKQSFKDVLTRVDTNFAAIIAGIEKQSLTSSVDVVVVSDHGLVPTATDKKVFYEDFFAKIEDVNIVQNRPMALIYPKDGFDYAAFEKTFPTLPNSANVKLMLKTKKAGESNAYPKEYLANPAQDRIPPITLVPNEGYTFAYKTENIGLGRVSLNPNQFGAAGYAFDEETGGNMVGVFAGRGPSFKSGFVSGGSKIRTVDIYPLLTKLIGVKPEVNNGTLEVFADLLK
ncbi:hypothetical protein HDU97_005170 [Phlyctochytrium planicorne]|nr:hypothetical protein HDU97_005170 [Phlyctochytrium planicorne]